ncbi:hypothetical protein L1887_59322 [Cichorium endivia]|nr:hypothetical protein L1887_59322 [Cichorium endivia]
MFYRFLRQKSCLDAATKLCVPFPSSNSKLGFSVSEPRVTGLPLDNVGSSARGAYAYRCRRLPARSPLNAQRSTLMAGRTILSWQVASGWLTWGATTCCDCTPRGTTPRVSPAGLAPQRGYRVVPCRKVMSKRYEDCQDLGVTTRGTSEAPLRAPLS